MNGHKIKNSIIRATVLAIGTFLIPALTHAGPFGAPQKGRQPGVKRPTYVITAQGDEKFYLVFDHGTIFDVITGGKQIGTVDMRDPANSLNATAAPYAENKAALQRAYDARATQQPLS